ncbi:PAS domain-containing protein [uncultured Sulfitobacter sp.]|uniref:methyl-accepting chemotaxis protein n=1 Tax=uncultured Sulfitobacter sp. TaxID=191468 RepID=UPI00260B4B00|nr:PAS domain-containing protein [uncultured Sulfitobacter sp.]
MDTVFESIFSAVDAFIYRCSNDAAYTMEHMAGGVQRLIGYAPEDILQNAKTSYVDLTAEEDKERVFADVDTAIAAGKPWDIAYRLIHHDGRAIWVRERGNAVMKDGEVAYLQGLVVGAGAEFDLRDKLERRVEEARAASEDIVGLTKQITSSVRELSMLSTNARIEAARSGEAGRGFAVVANEMKTLSERNAGLADKIAEQVQQFNEGPQ